MEKSYLEVKVPVKPDSQWFINLRNKMSENNIDVKWQNDYYHITVAFVYEMPEGVNFYPTLNHCLRYRAKSSLTFDKLDAFTTASRKHVIHLTSSAPSEEFKLLVNEVREAFLGLGCKIDQEFKLHVTLGRVSGVSIGLDDLKRIINEVDMPSFTLDLTKAQYLTYKDHKIIDSWEFYPDDQSAKQAKHERILRAIRNAGSNIQLYTEPEKFL